MNNKKLISIMKAKEYTSFDEAYKEISPYIPPQTIRNRLYKYNWSFDEAFELVPRIAKRNKGFYISDKYFNSIKEACDYYGITEEDYYIRKKKGMALEQCLEVNEKIEENRPFYGGDYEDTMVALKQTEAKLEYMGLKEQDKKASLFPVFSDGDHEDFTFYIVKIRSECDYYKYGITSDLASRLKTFRSHKEFEFVSTIISISVKRYVARYIENQIKNMLKPYHMKGPEYFDGKTECFYDELPLLCKVVEAVGFHRLIGQMVYASEFGLE